MRCPFHDLLESQDLLANSVEIDAASLYHLSWLRLFRNIGEECEAVVKAKADLDLWEPFLLFHRLWHKFIKVRLQHTFHSILLLAV